MSHVDSVLAHLPPEVHAAMEDPEFQKKCRKTFLDIQSTKAPGKDSAFLQGDELIDAVHRSVPEHFLTDRLHATNLKKLILSFDTNNDGRISQEEFDLFCMWVVAMNVMGFFAGTSPFGSISDVLDPSSKTIKNLLIVSEYLDPEHILGKCALPSTLCTYYHPDGITLHEFSDQIKAAAHVRTSHGCFFESVALANHGPDENGLWSVCSDYPVSLTTLDKAWPKLMPMFQALASMVSSPAHLGHVDLLACGFAANSTGVECIKMIEKQVNAKFAASTDDTGNVAQGGNWDLELGGRSVAPIYFYEEMLGQFTQVMCPASVKNRPHCKPQLGKGSGDSYLNRKAQAHKQGKPPVRIVHAESEEAEAGFV
jgi:hypothetical protein